MILYQIAKWMEERGRLLISIRERQGDIRMLTDKKRQIELKLLHQATLWRDGRQPLPQPSPIARVEAALTPPDPIPSIPVFLLEGSAVVEPQLRALNDS